jgi:glycine cleavage system H protein
MPELRFTEDHEWLRPEADGSVTVGITHYAQDQLGDVVYVQLPEAGRSFKAGEELAVIESVKAAGEIKAPFGVEVVAANTELSAKPELVNSDPEGAGWMLRVRPADPAAVGKLMDRAAYEQLVSKL